MLEQISYNKGNVREFKDMVRFSVLSDRPTMFHGSFGIGKSRIIEDIGQELNRPVKIVMLGQRSHNELLGLPFKNFNEEKQIWETKYTRGDILNIPENSILFLDELTNAHKPIQNAAFQLIEDRAIGDYKLPKGVTILAAGNTTTDGSIASRLVAPIANRMNHFYFEGPRDQEFLDYASSVGINSALLGFLKQEKTQINPVSHMNASDKAKLIKNTYSIPTPRSIMKLSDVLNSQFGSNLEELEKVYKTKEEAYKRKILLCVISSFVGSEFTSKFEAWLKDYLIVPTPEVIIDSPQRAKVHNTDVKYQIVASAKLQRFLLPDHHLMESYPDLVEYAKRNNRNAPKGLKVYSAIKKYLLRVGPEAVSSSAMYNATMFRKKWSDFKSEMEEKGKPEEVPMFDTSEFNIEGFVNRLNIDKDKELDYMFSDS